MEKLKSLDEFPYHLGDFKSLIPLTVPDAEAYTHQKGVNFIKVVPDELPEVELLTPLNDLHSESWKKLHAPLMNLSVSGNIQPKNCYPRTFPGPIIPGPLHTEQYVGSTSWELFNYVLTIPQRVIDIDKIDYNPIRGYFYNREKPTVELSNIEPPQNWLWDVKVPDIKQFQLSSSGDQESPETLLNRRGQIIQKLNTETDLFWSKFSIDQNLNQSSETLKMLELVQIVQSPFVKNSISDGAVDTANFILDHYKKIGAGKNILPLLFQIESSVMYAQTMSEREIIAKGFYGHSWIEVAKTNVENLRSTELVDEKRAIAEIVNLVNRGWAPIIVDEKINNTDGSHRGIAVRVWDLLKATGPSDFSDSKFQNHVKSFVDSRSDMKGLTLRETLRVTQELLVNPQFAEQKKAIFDALPNYPHVKYIPTIFLREQEACCVVKVPFDQKGEVIGVDPFVTFTLTNDRSDLALGSRGPYHRTDKSPAPWFNVFALQNI